MIYCVTEIAHEYMLWRYERKQSFSYNENSFCYKNKNKKEKNIKEVFEPGTLLQKRKKKRQQSTNHDSNQGPPAPNYKTIYIHV